MKFVLRNANMKDLDAVAQTYLRAWRETYQGILPQEAIDTLNLEKSTKKWRNEFLDQVNDADKSIFVVENEAGRIIGFSQCGAANARSIDDIGDGEIKHISIETDYQGYGLGKALMLASARWLINRGFFTGGAWIAEENGIGRRFCEDLGAKAGKKRKRSIGGYSINLLPMHWEDFTIAAQLENATPNWEV